MSNVSRDNYSSYYKNAVFSLNLTLDKVIINCLLENQTR